MSQPKTLAYVLWLCREMKREVEKNNFQKKTEFLAFIRVRNSVFKHTLVFDIPENVWSGTYIGFLKVVAQTPEL
jgi:hypothetical protein